MKIAVPTETTAGETRVSIVPDSVRTLVDLGFEVVVEAGAGLGACFADADYQQAGAVVVPTAAEALRGASVVARVRPSVDEVGKASGRMRAGRRCVDATLRQVQ